MLHRFFTAFNNLGGIPRRILLSGVLGAFAILVFATYLLFAPDYGRFVLSCQLYEAAVTIFAEGIVLGLFMDIFLNRTV